MTRSSWYDATLILAIAFATSACQGSAPPEKTGSGRVIDSPDISATSRKQAVMAFQDALETLPSNQTKRWKSPDGSASGFVTPLRTFRIATGHYCREFLETVSTNLGLLSSQGIACRTRKGHWLQVDKYEKS